MLRKVQKTWESIPSLLNYFGLFKDQLLCQRYFTRLIVLRQKNLLIDYLLLKPLAIEFAYADAVFITLSGFSIDAVIHASSCLSSSLSKL